MLERLASLLLWNGGHRLKQGDRSRHARTWTRRVHEHNNISLFKFYFFIWSPVVRLALPAHRYPPFLPIHSLLISPSKTIKDRRPHKPNDCKPTIIVWDRGSIIPPARDTRGGRSRNVATLSTS
jgi:hypothetical protein